MKIEGGFYVNGDREMLRRLAGQYMEAAADPRNAENAKLYRAVNGLRMIRPVVLIDEEPWCELDTDGSLTLMCEDDDCRGAELYLRKMLYKWRHHPVDMIVPPYLPVTKIIGGRSGWLEVKEKAAVTDGRNNIYSHYFEDQLEKTEDIEKLQLPALTYEKAATERLRDKLQELLGDTAPVKIVGYSSYISPWDLIARYRGVTPLLMDLVDRPEHMHAIMERVTEMYESQYRQYEELGLLESEPALIHCTCGLCDELGAEKGAPVRRRNVWGRGMAQIFSTVSPSMHREFEIEYQKRLMAPFGLVYYGCCEPLDKKIDIISDIPHLRKVSVTPWADVYRAAESIGKRYVVSAKANPAFVGAGFDKDAVVKEISAILDACGKYGCSCEIILKDISTVGGHPENLARWAETVTELVGSR